MDFNVPQNKKTGEVSDATRIVESLPTIKHILDRAHAVILMSHLGRPDGPLLLRPRFIVVFAGQAIAKFSLKPVVPVLEKLLGFDLFVAI